MYLSSLAMAIIAVLLFFVAALVSCGWVGIPMGWDSSYYLAYARLIAQTGFLAFFSLVGGYHVLYPLLLSTIASMGVPATIVESALPLVLGIMATIATAWLGRELSGDIKIGIFSAVFAAGWFGLYRMIADFHAELLAYLLLVFSTVLFVRIRDQRGKRYSQIGFFFCILIAAFVHVEVTMFFLVLWFVAFVFWDILSRDQRIGGTARVFLLGCVASAPSVVLWIRGILGLYSSYGGVLVSYSPVPVYWLEVLGPAVGLVFIGMFVSWRSLSNPPERSLFSRFVLTWSILSLTMGVIAYVITTVPIAFSDRSLLLLPIPLLLSLAFLWVLGRAFKTGIASQPSSIKIALLLIPLTITPITYSYITPNHYQVFISATTYSDLAWLVHNLVPDGRAVFIYDFPDQCAGILAQLNDNWVTYNFGPHLAYLGTLDNFALTRQTNYTNPLSQVMSNVYMSELRANHAFDSGLSTENVVLLASLTPILPPSAYSGALTEVHPGIWVSNVTNVANNGTAWSTLFSFSTAQPLQSQHFTFNYNSLCVG